MLEPWAEVKVPGLEDQDKPWNKVTVWPGGGGQGWEAILCLGEMEILADSTLACVMDFF